MSKHGPIYLGSDLDDKHGFLPDRAEIDVEETVIVYSEPRRRRCRQKHPLRKLARLAVTIGCVGFGAYMGLKQFYSGMLQGFVYWLAISLTLLPLYQISPT